MRGKVAVLVVKARKLLSLTLPQHQFGDSHVNQGLRRHSLETGGSGHSFSPRCDVKLDGVEFSVELVLKWTTASGPFSVRCPR